MARNVVPNTGVETIGTPDKRWSAIYADHVYTDDYVNVKQFGAKGDGVTDDTAAIQKAFDRNGAVIMFEPNKTYKISETLNIEDKTGIYIIGNNATIFLSADNSVMRHIIYMTGSNDIKVSNLNFERDITVIDKGELGWDLNLGRGAGDGFNFNNSSNILVEFCKFKYLNNGVVVGAQNRNADVRNNTFREFGGQPIVVDGATNVLVENNELYHHNGDGILIHDYAFKDDVLDGTKTYGIVIRGNFIHDGLLPVYNNALATTNPDMYGGGITTNAELSKTTVLQNGILIEGNTIMTAQYGINCIACGNIRIVNNYIDGTKGGNGIALYKSEDTTGNNNLPLRECLVANNTLTNLSGAYAGIYINMKEDADNRDVKAVCTGNILTNSLIVNPIKIQNTNFSGNTIKYLNKGGSSQACVQASNCIINACEIVDYLGNQYVKADNCSVNALRIIATNTYSVAQKQNTMPAAFDNCVVNNLYVDRGLGQINLTNHCQLSNVVINYPNTINKGSAVVIGSNSRVVLNNCVFYKENNSTYTTKLGTLIILYSNSALIANGLRFDVPNIYSENVILRTDDTSYLLLDNFTLYGGFTLPTTGKKVKIGSMTF